MLWHVVLGCEATMVCDVLWKEKRVLAVVLSVM